MASPPSVKSRSLVVGRRKAVRLVSEANARTCSKQSRAGGRLLYVWLLIPEGFFSIVHKDDEDELCVRSRVAADLEQLRNRYLPSLSETVETPGADYHSEFG